MLDVRVTLLGHAGRGLRADAHRLWRQALRHGSIIVRLRVATYPMAVVRISILI